MLEVLFENKDIFILNKPAGVLSVPARDSKDPRPVLGRELEKNVSSTIFPVHRLDYEVSGLIIYAKNPKSHQLLNGWFENKKIKKQYRALTTGPQFTHFPSEKLFDFSAVNLNLNQEMKWIAKLHKGKKRVFESPHGKDSVTLAKPIHQDSKTQTWELFPVTGRSHQLRWELSRHGYPILGDSLYGSRFKISENTVALRAIHLDFTLIQNEKINLNLPLNFSLSENQKNFSDLNISEVLI